MHLKKLFNILIYILSILKEIIIWLNEFFTSILEIFFPQIPIEINAALSVIIIIISITTGLISISKRRRQY